MKNKLLMRYCLYIVSLEKDEMQEKTTLKKNIFALLLVFSLMAAALGGCGDDPAELHISEQVQTQKDRGGTMQLAC